MAGSSGFAISITATDNATATLTGINKRLAALSAPAERFNKALAKFGDTSGINRVSEGFGSLGRTAHDAFMSIDRVSGPLAAITGAASIAGIVALTQRWADLGSTIGRTGFRLNMPVEQLSAMQGAGRRFGATTEAVTQSLSGLRETLYGAAWGRDPAAIQALGAIDKNLIGTPGHVTDTMKALDEIADRVAGEGDVHTKLRIMGSVGIDPSMLPLMNKGSKGIHEEMQRQADLGGTVTQQMTDDAIKTKQSFDDLGTAIGGVANRLGDDLGKRVEGYAESTAKWIGANRGVADSYAKIGVEVLSASTAISGLSKLLGFGFLGWAGPAALPASMLAAGAWNGAHNLPMVDEWGNVTGDWGGQDTPTNPGGVPTGNPIWNRLSRWWNGTQPAPITVPRSPSAAAGTMQRAHDYFRGKGITEEQTAGILSNMAAESGFDPTKSGDNGASYGLFQDHADRLRGMRARYGATPNEQQQLDYAWDELNTTEKPTLDRLRGVHTAGQAGAIFSGFERPADGPGEAFRRGQAADQFVQPEQGHVQVDVHLHGATAGTSAKVTTSGPVTAPPPRIETPMPMN